MRWIKILRRILVVIPIMFGVAIVVFAFMRFMPGDPVDLMMGQAGYVSEEEVNLLREEFNLDKPLHVQLGIFLSNAIKGDLGNSITKRQPVTSLIKERLPATIELSLAAFLIAIIIALPVGIISAVKQNSWIDRLTMTGALFGISMPVFWFGIILIILFSVRLGIFPVSGRLDHSVNLQTITNFYLIDSILTGNMHALGDVLKHLFLPAFTLGLSMIATLARITRSSMLEVLRQDYITLARAKGLREFMVIMKHGLRNALIPVVTVTSLQLGAFLGGNMIVETIFGWPGVGRLVVEAIFSRDYPLVQGSVMVYAFIYVFANLCADILYTYLNPKINL